jgi:putative endonuclease
MRIFETGKRGEDLAKGFFSSLGYRLLDANYRTKHGEIDLIFMDGRVLVFVEVKTRKKKSSRDIELLIDKRKANRILKSAEIYINNSDIEFEEIRLDALFVELKSGEPLFKHIKSFY